MKSEQSNSTESGDNTGKSSRVSRKHKIVASLVVAGTAVGVVMVGHAMKGGHFGGHGFGQHGPKQAVMSMVRAMDTDKSGSVSKVEVDTLRQEKFSRHDGNASGDLVLEEFQALWLEIAHPVMVDHFQMLDHDGDGQVTESEFSDPIDRIMTHLDKNQDGEVTMEELQSRRGKHRHNKDA